MLIIFPVEAPHRKIKANDQLYNAEFKYTNNYISTSKYSVITFIPKNLFEQFQRIANFYFLILLVLQLIPQISSLTPLTTIIPLIAVLTISAIKDAVDDWVINNRSTWVLSSGGKLVEERWRRVVVGDIIKLENNQFVTADLLILSSSEPNSLCYVETAELDGETNLKVRQALAVTGKMESNLEQMSEFDGLIECESPNNNLNTFEGVLYYDDESYSLSNNNLLLRGCILRNTEWCFGLVVFAGKDTKLMMNSGKGTFKRTNIDKLLNKLIIGIFIFLFLICAFCSIGCGIWELKLGYQFQHFLPWETYGVTVSALLVFLSYFIVLNTLVPISLYVSVEMIRFGHSWWINWDKEMYYKPLDIPAKSRTTTLNEELGQIRFIFSDKTGTLTQNIMAFLKCSINGIKYGHSSDDPKLKEQKGRRVDFSDNPMYEPSFKFYDQDLWEQVKRGNPHVHMFFRLLSLCHTVMPDTVSGNLEYKAQSPDEGALVSAARNFGFVFKDRSMNSITVEVMGRTEIHDLLVILDFTNERKRMSVILKKDNRITLYCKGADSTVFKLLDKKSHALMTETNNHLNLFAQNGLRTLVCAFKEIDPFFYQQWVHKYHKASVALVNRAEKLEEVYEEIERGMVLIGATAIEDKLQDGVSQTINNLVAANMKFWLLTGDKIETAVNIGYSCGLLKDEMEDVFIVDEETRQATVKTVEDKLKINKDVLNAPAKNSATANLSSMSFVGLFSANSSPSSRVPDLAVAGAAVKFESREDDERGKREALLKKSKADDEKKKEKSRKGGEMEDGLSSSLGAFALVISGASLLYMLESDLEDMFCELGCSCSTVICCRVTPLQKAMVVDLIKKKKKTITLAIGDGANDVSMIRTAHIGVGLSGQEGMQAVLASDFSLAQFRYLERLLLVHGRWSYLRMCKFLSYFFYKNFAFTFCHVWYAFFCGFSAQTLYDEAFISLYNICYTSLPVLALGIFEQDVNDDYSLTYPSLYTPGHKNLFFNKKIFAMSVVEGVVSSLVLFFVPYASFYNAVKPNGQDLGGHKAFGTIVASSLIVTVTLRCALDTWFWTGFNHFVIWGSIVFYFAFTFIFYSELFDYTYLGTSENVMGTTNFFFTLILVVTMLLLPVVSLRFYRLNKNPTLTDLARVKQRETHYKNARLSRLTRGPKASSVANLMVRQRSGYAFSHQEGFGNLITSGWLIDWLVD
ncbi:hypothetical protein HELRODRAFT_75635 [Helobdella robusta]|uniref:Phospholipid-transporting ATPase n=1 Tax=Helobdella robusta TaxID=6412 RepID=T1G280_HELRO|nr:hypothetical protein HELRODRAFT_75635 [Helobdella robusta]ESO08153.1 hypothetical protein HELRODRAFT_75635 [Helobdella robusta]